jgi:chemotaxis signal transduction protein
MGIYKNIELDDRLCQLIRYMSSAEEYRETLQGLQGVWDNLTLLGQLSGTGADMSATRQAFYRLTVGLLDNLGNETLKKVVLEMKSKAQVAVDILIRNLFERTADIGFLATDEDICDYAARAPGYLSAIRRADNGEADSLRREYDALTHRLQSRFNAYVQKYSVYDNIILLDTEGNVLIQHDPHNRVQRSEDPLIRESLQTGNAYVETFRKSDLVPGQPVSLIYSYRVISPDDSTPLGVLCLCFRFENETAGIFDNLKDTGDWSVITLLDSDGRVIASSDAWHIPVGAPMERVLDSDYRVVRFAGREYLAATRATGGYQGYTGLGWFGHVMVPLEHAFDTDASAMLALVSGEVLNEVMSNPSLFSEDLRNIPLQAERIQRELNRSVWNGNVRQNGDRKALNPAFSKILLWEISNTGLKTKDVFERSIGNLHQTVVSAILQDSRFLAALAIDIMDRNLYERANDCRWWALRSSFGELLASRDVDAADVADMQSVLAHINSLYTVYDNLLLFDRHGRIIAVSNPKYQSLCGEVLNEDWVHATLCLTDAQQYAVSAFAATPLYHDRHTYIYGAAIYSNGGAAGKTSGNKTVGGIGIVFDAEPQFAAMLQDALPRDASGNVMSGAFGVFADSEQRVIASTSADIRPGSLLDVDGKFFTLASGAGIANIVIRNNDYYAVGSCMSAGYREYKNAQDSYRNDVIALIFVPLCPVNAANAKAGKTIRQKLQLQAVHGTDIADAIEVATFHVGDNWLGIRADRIVEAVEARGLTRMPGVPSYLLGHLLYLNGTVPVVDIAQLMPGRNGVGHEPGNQIVLVRIRDNIILGIMVNSLGEIPAIAPQRVQAISAMFPGDNAIVDSVVKPEVGDASGEMLMILDADRLYQRVA